MPRVNQEWAREIQRVLEERGGPGAPLPLRVAARMTDNRVSYGAIGDWTKGDVPTDPDKIRIFADVLREPRVRLIAAAGYLPTEEDASWDRSQYGVDVQVSGATVLWTTNQAEAFFRGEASASTDVLRHLARLGQATWDRVPWVGSIHAGSLEVTDPTPNIEEGMVRVVVEGDCMEPVIEPGDVLRIRTHAMLRNGDVVAVRLGDEVILREYRADETRVYLTAYNERHSARTLPRDDGYEVLGVVVGIEKSVRRMKRIARKGA